MPEGYILELKLPILDLNGFSSYWVPWIKNRFVANPENPFFPENPWFSTGFARIFTLEWKFLTFDRRNEFLDPKLVQFDINYIKIG